MLNFYLFNIISQKIKNFQSQKKLFNSLQIGDSVWAKMPLSKKELKKIESNHRIRPYLVVKKDMVNIYAFQSSSKPSKNLNNIQQYCIHKKMYNKNKDSFIDLKQVYKIPFYNLRTKSSTLNIRDLSNIEKRLLAQNNKNDYSFSVSVFISDGDVILIKCQLYYVYAFDNGYLYCLTIFKKCPKDENIYIPIIINNKTYYTDFKNKVQFSRATPFSIINIAYKEEVLEILKKKKEFEIEQKQMAKLLLSANKQVEKGIQKRNYPKSWKK